MKVIARVLHRATAWARPELPKRRDPLGVDVVLREFDGPTRTPASRARTRALLDRSLRS